MLNLTANILNWMKNCMQRFVCKKYLQNFMFNKLQENPMSTNDFLSHAATKYLGEAFDDHLLEDFFLTFNKIQMKDERSQYV